MSNDDREKKNTKTRIEELRNLLKELKISPAPKAKLLKEAEKKKRELEELEKVLKEIFED